MSSMMTGFAWRVFRESTLLLCFSALVALVVAFLHPHHPDWRLPYPAEISMHALRAHQERLLWVDARSQSSFASGHIPGAVSLNEDQWQALLPSFLDRWQPDSIVVVYCDSHNCSASQAVARRLQREFQIRNIRTLKGDWTEWLSQVK